MTSTKKKKTSVKKKRHEDKTIEDNYTKFQITKKREDVTSLITIGVSYLKNKVQKKILKVNEENLSKVKT